MRTLSIFKEVQQLIGHIAALLGFLFKFAERTHPFFCLLKKQTNFEWTEEYERAFQDLKKILIEPLVLSKLRNGEPLYMYLSVTEKSISLVLVKGDQKQQKPVYYVSKALQRAKVRYPKIEKLAFTLVVTAQRLRPYFQGIT